MIFSQQVPDHFEYESPDKHHPGAFQIGNPEIIMNIIPHRLVHVVSPVAEVNDNKMQQRYDSGGNKAS
jgi:hypothetical protein